MGISFDRHTSPSPFYNLRFVYSTPADDLSAQMLRLLQNVASGRVFDSSFEAA